MSLRHSIEFITTHPLSHGRRLRNVARFVALQLGSRLSMAPDSFAYVNGSRMLLRRGMTGATGNFYTGLHEFEEMSLLLHLLRPGDLFVDVGANVGSYTVLASSAIGARVLAFEPGPEARGWLQRNVELNKAQGRVEVRPDAIGATEGTTAFSSGLDTVNHRIQGADAKVEDVVPMTTLDLALEGRSATLIKIDVEGFESDVIAGGTRTLHDPGLKCVIIELAGAGALYGFDEDKIRRDLLGMGFGAFRYEPFKRQLLPRGTAGGHGNSIFLRDLAVVEQRLSDAPAFEVLGRRV